MPSPLIFSPFPYHKELIKNIGLEDFLAKKQTFSVNSNFEDHQVLQNIWNASLTKI